MTLPEDQSRVLELLYGLGDGVSHDPAQAARLLGLPVERVLQLEHDALVALRRILSAE